MIYQIASGTHISASVMALLTGLMVVLLPKGTRFHRALGYFYVLSMLNLSLSALFIYKLTGRFGPFHVGALASLVILVAGIYPVYFRRPRRGWLERHFEFMSWSFVGLVAAAAAETATRLPDSPFWGAVVVSSLIIYAIGGAIIVQRRSKYITGIWTPKDN